MNVTTLAGVPAWAICDKPWPVTRSCRRPAATGDLTLPQPPPDNAFGLVLAVGLVRGAVNREGNIEPVGYAGSGKIMEVK